MPTSRDPRESSGTRPLACWRLAPEAVADLARWVLETAERLGGYARAQLEPLHEAVSGLLAVTWGTGTMSVAVEDGEVIVRVQRTGSEELLLFRP